MGLPSGPNKSVVFECHAPLEPVFILCIPAEAVRGKASRSSLEKECNSSWNFLVAVCQTSSRSQQNSARFPSARLVFAGKGPRMQYSTRAKCFGRQRSSR